MADRRHLAARLRREARGERPAFSAALHDGVLAAVAAARRIPRPAGRRRPTPRPAVIRGAAAAACACAALVTGGWWSLTPRPGGVDPAAAVADAPGIERLPTPVEIGEGVLAEVTTLAADAVGLPTWPDLAVLEPVTFSPGDTMPGVRAAD